MHKVLRSDGPNNSGTQSLPTLPHEVSAYMLNDAHHYNRGWRAHVSLHCEIHTSCEEHRPSLIPDAGAPAIGQRGQPIKVGPVPRGGPCRGTLGPITGGWLHHWGWPHHWRVATSLGGGRITGCRSCHPRVTGRHPRVGGHPGGWITVWLCL